MGFTAGTFKAAVQGAKGTAVTTGSEFLCGLYTSITPPWADKNFTDDEFLYGCSSGTLTTAKKSLSTVTDYLGRWSVEGPLFPVGPGVFLRGLGFGAVTTGTTLLTHTFTLEAVSAQDWLTILADIDTAFQMRLTDSRVSNLTLNHQRDGLTVAVEGAGLTLDEYATAITPTDETNTKIVQSADGSGSTSTGGSFALNIGGANVVTDLQSHEFVIENPLDEEQFGLFALAHTDLTPNGLAVRGTVSGVTMTEALYKNIDWGSATGTSPSAIERAGDVAFTYESFYGYDGTTATAPYSFTVTIPSVGIRRASEPVFTGGETVRLDIEYQMVADTATPITIVLKNQNTGAVY